MLITNRKPYGESSCGIRFYLESPKSKSLRKKSQEITSLYIYLLVIPRYINLDVTQEDLFAGVVFHYNSGLPCFSWFFLVTEVIVQYLVTAWAMV